MDGASSAPWQPSGVHDGTAVPGRELRLLLQAVQEWLERGGQGEHGGLGLVHGEPGSGKSLLLAALARTLEEAGASCATALCGGDRSPLLPFRQVFRRVLGRGDPLEALEPFLPELVRLFPGLPWPLRPPPFPALGADLERSRVTDTVAGALAVLASPRPLVIVLEELQSIDPLSLEVLLVLLRCIRRRGRRGAGPRLLVLAEVRAADRERLEESLPRLELAFEVEARGYSREDLLHQAAALGLDLPLTAREALQRATGGNPFAASFLLRRVVGAGEAALAAAAEEWARAGPEALPRQAAARLETLPGPQVRAVQVFSALGRAASPEKLVGLLPGAGAGGAEAILRSLQDSGWVRPAGPGEDGRPQWALSGELLGKVALERLPATERAVLHGELGELLLSDAAGGAASVQEAFFHLALAPGHPRLLAAGRAAAAEAAALGDLARAIEVQERLLETLERTVGEPLLAELEGELAGLLERAGIHREALRILRRLEPSPPHDPEARARHRRRLGQLHGRLGESVLEEECYRAGLEALEGVGESMEGTLLLILQARLTLERGEQEEGELLLEGVKLPPRQSLSSLPGCREVYRLAEEALYRKGDHAAALAFEEVLLEEASARGDGEAALLCMEHLAHLHLLGGSAEAAHGWLERGVLEAGKCGSRLAAARFIQSRGRLRGVRGESEQALQDEEEALEVLEELGREAEVGDLQLSIVHRHLHLFRFEEASQLLLENAARFALPPFDAAAGVFPPLFASREARQEAIRGLRERLQDAPGGPGAQGQEVLRSQLAELLLEAGEMAEAARLLDEALRPSQAPGTPLALARVLQRAGRLHRARGERARALWLFEKGLEFLGAAPDRALVGNAYLEVAGIVLVQGEAGRAYDFLLRGLRLFVDLKDGQGLVAAVLALAEFLLFLDLPHLARSFAEAALELCRPSLPGRWEAEAQRLLGAAAREADDRVSSERSLARAQQVLEPLGMPLELSRVRLEMGWTCCRYGQFGEALRLAREGIESSRVSGAQDLLEEFCFLLGVVETSLTNRSKNFLRALELLNQALLGAQERARPFVERRVLLAMARIYAERGKDDLAREYEKKAEEIRAALRAGLPAALEQRLEAEPLDARESRGEPLQEPAPSPVPS